VKLGRGGVVALGVTAAVLAFSAGHFVGGGSINGDYQVSVQRPAETQMVELPSPAPTAEATTEPSAKLAMVDINSADSEELQTLPGIGPQRAADIIAYREEHGPFRYPEDITKVSGIGEGVLAQIIDYITAEEVTK
jgi:comEA protein